MGQFLGFGSGEDGIVTLSGTDAPIDSSCSGSSGATSLAATNASFAAGQIILIHQSRGTGAGSWEINKIASYVAGTITTELPLDNTYTDSGESQAQVLVLKQYSQVTISATLTTKSYDGNLGGIIAFLCNGKVTVSGTITANGLVGSQTTSINDNGGGFRGGAGTAGGTATQGESSLGAGAAVDPPNNNNGSGGGGGKGGGGGGSGGTIIQNISDLTSKFIFGGAGGGANTNEGSTHAKCGGNSAGLILIFAKEIIVSGAISANGGQGRGGTESNSGGGGGGSGGCIFLKGEIVTLGTNLITATKGLKGSMPETTGGDGGGGGGGSASGDAAGGAGQGQGGDGSPGVIRIEACNRTGTTNPGASESIGGYIFCASPGAIL